MDPEVGMDHVAEVGSGIGLVVDRVVFTVVEPMGADVDGLGADEKGCEGEGKGLRAWVEGPGITVLSVWSVEVTGATEVVGPFVVVLEVINCVLWLGPLEVGQLMGVQHSILIW